MLGESMIIELGNIKDKSKIARLDTHIPLPRLGECIYNQQVYVLKDVSIKIGGTHTKADTTTPIDK